MTKEQTEDDAVPVEGDEYVDKTVYGAIRMHRAAERVDRLRNGYKQQGFDIDNKFTERVTNVVIEELCRGAFRVAMACRDCATHNRLSHCKHRNRVQHLIVALPPIDWDAKMPPDDLEFPVLTERIQDLLEEAHDNS